MYKDNLFKLIRSEEVIIWAGAGLSRYAGFPSGEKLGNILYDSLSESEQKQINPNLLLPDLAEEFYRIKGHNKNSLIRILKKHFIDYVPTSTTYHDKLATIPHFKTIITTNYDKLIENAYGHKGQLLLEPKHVPYLEQNKMNIFKVHGDLSEPDSIILTRTDYNNFFKNGYENDVYWNVIKERISTKNVLFIGYNLEDPNVSVIFDRISDVLGQHRKECFFVSPDLPQLKINDLVKKNIHYINSTGEALIDELLINIKENIVDDLEKGITSADTFRDFLLNLNLIADIKGDKDSFKLLSLDGIEGNVKGTINFSLKNDEEFIKGLNDFIKGKKFGDFEIPSENLLKSNFSFGGIKLPGSDDIAWLKFSSNPAETSLIDIRFDDGSDFTEIPVKIYRSSYLIEIRVQLKNALLKISLEPVFKAGGKIDYAYKHEEICSKVKDEIELFTLLNKYASGQRFKIHTQSGKTYLPEPSKLPPLVEFSQFYLTYFKGLKLIEQYYDVRFVNIKYQSISKENYELVCLAVAVTKGETLDINLDKEIQIELNDVSEQILNQLQNKNKKDAPLRHTFQQQIIEIHGQKINLGFKEVEYLEPEFLNFDSFIKKEEKLIKFKCKKIRVTYSRTSELE